MIYHILASDEWKSASRNEYYSPDSFAVDGFIHCCTEEQLEYVGERHFRGRQGLVILCIEEGALMAPVKYEDLNGEGMLFPNLYGPINTGAVRNVTFTIPSS
ncbi:MAG: DUF952 domain-containing protein [Acidobacteria bacterium]|nr:MAG: DUF952 domain-containing protein [Acidobacteriota bacterium]